MKQKKIQITVTRKKEAVKKKKGGGLFFILIFILGFGVLLFPLVSRYAYYRASKVMVKNYLTETEKLTPEDVGRRFALALAYNDALFNGYGDTSQEKQDPFTKEEHEAGKKEYARMLEVNEQIGTIVIPKISEELPVFAGTSEIVLQKGAGHVEGTSLPVGGNNTHSVITAHRGLPNARLFTDLNRMGIGDYFYFKNIKETIAYQIDEVKVILPEEIDTLKIVPGHDYMTLLTCTPYMINSHRLLVRGHRVPYIQEVMEKQIDENRSSNIYRILFFITFLFPSFTPLAVLKKKEEKD